MILTFALSGLLLAPTIFFAQTDSFTVDSLVIEYFKDNEVVIDSDSYYCFYDEICNWMETPYLYGGNSRHGTDCSGFVKSIYQNVYNISMTGSSGDIYSHCKPVGKELLCEGDLVFFNINNRKISHMGIYLERGKFVHASSSLGVIISKLDEKYYAKHYFGGGKYVHKHSEKIANFEQIIQNGFGKNIDHQ